MSEEEEENGGGDEGGKRTRFTGPGGVITYKRRKRSSMGSGGVMQRGPSVCSGDQVGVLARTEQCWKAIFEEILLSQDADDNGIWSCIEKDSHEGHGNLHGKAGRVNSFFNAAKKQEVTLSELQREISEQADICVITKCKKVLLEVLTSEKFAFLCNFLLGNFPGIKASSIIDFSQIHSKMEKVTNGHSIRQFHQDLQQVWERIKKIGQEMVLLATSLSKISQAAYHKQRPHGFGTEDNSGNSHTTKQFPYESEPSTKLEQTEASCLYKVSICKQCGAEADGKHSLICDGCEAVYHVSCVKPAVQGIPTQNWYCSTCTRDQKESTEPDRTNTNHDSPHQNCVVCNRLKAFGAFEQQTHDDGENVTTVNESREGSVSSMVSAEPPQPSQTALSRLCKICRTCEDDERKFIHCGNSCCLYKYYHIGCLRTSQIANQHQHPGCWYCPSCLCRACLIDKDDDMIVLCDGCDEAYHTYCMKPPLTSVPEGKWYCVQCNILRVKEGMRRYEQWVLQQHGQSDGKKITGSSKSMEMLLNAADKEETLVASSKTDRGLF